MTSTSAYQSVRSYPSIRLRAYCTFSIYFSDLLVPSFPKKRRFHWNIIIILFVCRENLPEKCSKSSTKVCKYLVQQNVQEIFLIFMMYFS